MIRPSLRLALLLATSAAALLVWLNRPSRAPRARASFRANAATATPPAAASPEHESARQRLTYAQHWNDDQPPALAAFREWTERYLRANAAARAGLEAEGAALARARRPAMLTLIRTEPERAFAVTVPAAVRAQLPASVLAELEARVAGRGDFMLLAALPQDGEPAPRALRRVAAIGGVSYTTYTYGRREAQLTKEGASLHGIAIDRELALHESPVRLLEPDETPVTPQSENCPVTNLAAETNSSLVAEAFGRTWQFCGTTDDMLEQFESRLTLAEDGADPRVPFGVPPTAAEATSSRTVGTQKLLVIRVDFSDFPGASVAATDAQTTMESNVRPFYEEGSYGLTSLDTTVSTQVYRLPQTGAAYARADNEAQLHADARALAAADFTLANYSRIAVVFPNLGTSRVSGSLITFAGEASIGGTNIWINGTFSWQTVAHELGHTYGLYHANLWQVADTNPVSPNGLTIEYGDPFDMMGSSSITGVARDTRHHFNPRFKNRLGWLPDSAVTTVTTSGAYRIYRFDQRDATKLNQPLALRIFRDGVRWFWVGYRQQFANGTPTANGAYVVWSFNGNQQSQLLDLTTPGASATDAVIPVGATFTDPSSGVAIKVTARGGADPAQFLDLDITVPAAPRDVVSAWGRDTVLFYTGNTGVPTAPAPETAVPIDLTNVTAIAAGDTHAVALKSDGTVVVWGNDLQGQTGIPIGLADVVSIAAGGNACGAIKRDGTVRIWGDTTTGQRNVPSDLVDVKQIALGTNHVLALKTDGTVVAWGNNANGQTTVPADLTDVVAIAAGNGGSLALKRDGTVVGWGVSALRTIPLGLSNVVAISACGSSSGGTHALALRRDGTIEAWGNNANGQTTVPADLVNVVAIAAGGFHSLALKADGTVVAWGSNGSGALNVPTALPRSYAIAASARGSFALTGANVYFTAQPADQIATTGSTATFSVTATGATPLTYQWRKDGVAIAGATSSTLTLANVAASASASYDVVVSDGRNSRATFPARLTVATGGPEVARISNLSILTSLASRTDSFRMGFVVGGAGTSGGKRLVIRAAGPSLGALGVPGTLGDPTVTLFTGPTQIAANDDWELLAPLASAMAAVGAFPLTDRLDAVLAQEINGRDNTVVVGSAFSGAPSGAVIAEIYDATPSAIFTASVPRLINVSVLKDIGTSLTTGFVIAGPAGSSKRVLIRAIGPGLAVVGVTSGFVPDPKLTLFGAASAKIAENDNWGDTTELNAAFNSVGAFFVPSNSKDAALIATLAQGVNYTAQVTGAGGASGLALVEVYELP